MTVQLGINPLTWTNDDMPSLGGDTPLETCLSEGKSAGFAGFELGHKFPRDPEILGPILDKHGLQLVSGWYSGFMLERTAEEEIEAVQEHLNLLKSLGSKVMVFCEVTHCIHGNDQVPLSQRPTFPKDQWDQYIERLTTFARYLQSEGVHLAYHHHMGTVIQSEEDIHRLMESTGPEVGLLLDSGHLVYAGGDPVAVAKRWIDRIVHVHCKDIREAILKDALNRDLPFLKAVLNGVFTVPGDGFIDYESIFKELKEGDYNGWMVVEAEQDPSVATPLTYATMGYKNLKILAKDAQLL
jgi:inosose dehydratase